MHPKGVLPRHTQGRQNLFNLFRVVILFAYSPHVSRGANHILPFSGQVFAGFWQKSQNKVLVPVVSWSFQEIPDFFVPKADIGRFQDKKTSCVAPAAQTKNILTCDKKVFVSSRTGTSARRKKNRVSPVEFSLDNLIKI